MDDDDEEERDDEAAAEDERGANALARDSRLKPQYVHMLLDWAGRRTEHDPSLGGTSGYDAAMRRWRHLLECVPMSELLWTHDSVSPRFAHGRHGGSDLWSLYYDLNSDRTRVEDLTPIVVGQWRDCLWAITGNRRLLNLSYLLIICLLIVCACCLMCCRGSNP